MIRYSGLDSNDRQKCGINTAFFIFYCVRCMQESTIKFNLAYMRLLCGLLLFSIIDYCLLPEFLSSGSLTFLL